MKEIRKKISGKLAIWHNHGLFLQNQRAFTPPPKSFCRAFLDAKIKLKSKLSQKYNQNVLVTGFTVIELLVAISIMVMLSTLIIANLAGQRASQKIKIAQNELVTNLRKIQNYTLASRLVNNNLAVQYYLLKIDLKNPNQYTIQAMYDVDTAPKLAVNVETIKLPQGIRFASIGPVVITRNVAPTPQTPTYPNGCALIVFKLPFAQTLFSNGCSMTGTLADPYIIQNMDDYKNVLNFVVNTNGGTVSGDANMVVTLTDDAGTLTKQVIISGVSGRISAQ